jgi:hypothetical protein
MTMAQYLRYALGVTALIGFLISLAVHVEALRGIDMASSMPSVWLLHAGIFVVFVPFVLFSRKDFANNRSYFDTIKGLPHWVAILQTAIFAYALVNFALFIFHSEGGNPTIEHGKYLLMEHGRLIRELTPTEYTAFKANEVRGFSGHWLLFYFVPAAYFLFWKSPTLESTATPTSSEG